MDPISIHNQNTLQGNTTFYVSSGTANALTANNSLNVFGKVGIGTNNPFEPVDIYKAGGGAGIRFISPGVAEYKIGVPSSDPFGSLHIANTNFLAGGAYGTQGIILDAANNTNVVGTLGVVGAATLNSTLKVVSDADLDSGLNVDGASTFNSSMTVRGGANFTTVGSTFASGAYFTDISSFSDVGNVHFAGGAADQVLRKVPGGGMGWVYAYQLVSGDNLGDHIATTTLNMALNSITNVASMTMVDDGLRIGTDLTTNANGIFISTSGALMTLGMGNGSALPNARGIGGVDLQTYRAAATQVGSGAYSVLSGGIYNLSLIHI